MNIDKLLKLADLFYKLAGAEAEKLQEDSKDLKTILKNIEELETFNARKEYAEKNLKRLSSGSSRLVYLTDNKTVIKLASNDRGIAQNKAEANPKMTSPFLNKIISSAKNHSWLETHFLDKITTKEFEKLTGMDFDDFGESIRYELRHVSGNKDKSKPDNFDDVAKSELFKEMKRIGLKYKLMGGDIARISSFGTKDGKPVLIDAGLTKEVYDKYYDDSTSDSKKSTKSK